MRVKCNFFQKSAPQCPGRPIFFSFFLQTKSLLHPHHCGKPHLEELIDYANRSGAPEEVIENLTELEEDGEIYESIEDIWPDYPTKEDFFFNEEEY